MDKTITGSTHLFLTSKVRLYCDVEWMMALPDGWVLFLTSKVRLHCDAGTCVGVVAVAVWLFLTSKIRFYIFLRIICTPLLEGFIVNPSRQSGSFFIAAMSTRWTI